MYICYKIKLINEMVHVLKLLLIFKISYKY